MLAVAAGFPPSHGAVRADVVDEGREWTDATLAACSVMPGIGASYLMSAHAPIVSV